MRQIVLPVTASALALVLSACGGSGSSESSASSNAAPAADEFREMTAEQVAAKARKGLICPPKMTTPTRGEGGPVDDVVGVRPGLSYDEAVNATLCDNSLLVVAENTRRGFQIPTYGVTLRQGFDAAFAEPVVELSRREFERQTMDRIMNRDSGRVLEPGQIRFYVATMGLPGEEKVIRVSREQRFKEGEMPTVEAVVGALQDKYGEASKKQDFDYRLDITWAHDARQRKVTETSPLLNSCNGVANPADGFNLDQKCGVVVKAEIIRSRTNNALVETLMVGSVDQKMGSDLIEETEASLLKQDEERKRKEIEDAGAADNVKL